MCRTSGGKMILSYDINKLKDLLRSFYRLTKIRIVVYNDVFEKIAEVPDYDCSFCRLIRSDKNAEKICLASDKYACEMCQKNDALYSYTCHAGLTETVTPIRHGNIIIGYLMFGQVLQTPDPNTYWNQIVKKCSSYNVDMEQLYQAYLRKQPMEPGQVHASAQILEACAGYLWLQRYISLKEDSLPNKIDEYITNNLDADLSVAALCNRFNISRSKLYKIFHEYFGSGVEQMTRSLRIDKAKELLKECNDPVSEIAYQVGYIDYNYFIKVFKKETEFTPIQFRKLNQSSK